MTDTPSVESNLVRRSFGAWFELHGAILNKKRQVLRFPELQLNKMQRQIDEIIIWCLANNLPCRIVTLKGRQQGSSTVSVGAAYKNCRERPTKCCIIGDLYERSVANLVAMFDDYAANDTYDWGNTYYVPGKRFSNGSLLVTETANSPRAGASGTLQTCILTEVAHWKESTGKGGGKISAKAVFAALLNCVPAEPGTLVIVESTPNGAAGAYYDTYQAATSFENVKAGALPPNWNGFIRVFYPWHEHPEYRIELTPEQEEQILNSLSERELELMAEQDLGPDRLAWRRMKLADPAFAGNEDKFEEEFPADEERCLTAETRVGTSKGYVRIDQVEVGAMSDHGTIEAKKMMGVKPVVRVTTKHGFTVRATADHRFAVGNGFIEAGDLMGQRITLQPPVLATEYHTVKWTGFAGVQHELAINEEWGAFLGYFAGDGCFGGDELCFACDKRDQDVVQRIADLTEMVVGRKPRRQISGSRKGGENIRIGDKRLREVFEELGVIKETIHARGDTYTSRRVCVPECIWKSPKPVVREFLRCLFESDGWSSPTVCTIKFFTKHLSFAQDVQRLLLAFGVQGRIRQIVKTVNGKKFPGVDMQLCSVDAAKFMQEVGFVSERKRNTVAASKVVNKGLSDRYTYTDEVVSIEPDGEEEVWDIQVKGQPVFSANGILVHNCFLLSGRRAFPAGPLMRLRKAAEREAHLARFGVLQWTPGSESKAVMRQTGRDEAWCCVWELPTPGLIYSVSVDPMTGQAHGDDPDNHGIGVWREGYFDQYGKWKPKALVARLADFADEARDPKKRACCKWDINLTEGRVALLASYYGWATIAVEINMDRGLVALLRNRPMAQLYVRSIPLKIEQKDALEYGWHTSTKTRGAIMETLKSSIRHWDEQGQGLMIWDLPTIREMETMVMNDGKEEAGAGCHDDQVLMAAIGLATLGAGRVLPYPRRRDEGGPQRRDMTFS